MPENKKKRSGTRSVEERTEILDKKIQFHKDCIKTLEDAKEKLLNPTPRTRTKLPKYSDEDLQKLELIKQSGKSLDELLALLEVQPA